MIKAPCGKCKIQSKCIAYKGCSDWEKFKKQMTKERESSKKANPYKE